MPASRATRTITVTGILAALSIALTFLEVPLPFLFPTFLKLDASELPALLAAFALGPVAGFAVEVLKNFVHFLSGVNGSGGIGELANVVAGSGLVVTAGLVYRFWKRRAGALVGMAAGVVVMTVLACLGNYFFFLRWYGMPAEAVTPTLVLSLYAPFNLLKGLLVSLLTALVYKRVSPLLHGAQPPKRT